MNIDELDSKIQDFIGEMRAHNNAISANHLSLVNRLDTLDLNGAARYLRDFGYFLRDHPDFMKREADQESKRVRREIAMTWIAETLHLTDIRKKSAWVLTALLTGVLLTFGNYLVGLLSVLNSMFHSFGHQIFK